MRRDLMSRFGQLDDYRRCNMAWRLIGEEVDLHSHANDGSFKFGEIIVLFICATQLPRFFSDSIWWENERFF